MSRRERAFKYRISSTDGGAGARGAGSALAAAGGRRCAAVGSRSPGRWLVCHHTFPHTGCRRRAPHLNMLPQGCPDTCHPAPRTTHRSSGVWEGPAAACWRRRSRRPPQRGAISAVPVTGSSHLPRFKRILELPGCGFGSCGAAPRDSGERSTRCSRRRAAPRGQARQPDLRRDVVQGRCASRRERQIRPQPCEIESRSLEQRFRGPAGSHSGLAASLRL